MASRPSWTGGLEFAGFPISVQFWPTVSSKSGDSFKMLDPKHKRPVKQVLHDVKGKPVDRDATLRGVEQNGKIKVIPPKALTAISELGMTKIAKPHKFVQVDTIPFTLSQGAYEVVPNPKVDGSPGPVKLLRDGLRASGLAYVTEITMRSGAADRIVAVWANADGLYATLLPHKQDVQSHGYDFGAEDSKAGKVFQQFLEVSDYEVGVFDHAEFESEHTRLREQAVRSAIAGKDVVVPDQPDAVLDEAPDLMAALEAAVSAKKAPPKKPRAKKAVKA